MVIRKLASLSLQFCNLVYTRLCWYLKIYRFTTSGRHKIAVSYVRIVDPTRCYLWRDYRIPLTSSIYKHSWIHGRAVCSQLLQEGNTSKLNHLGSEVYKNCMIWDIWKVSQILLVKQVSGQKPTTNVPVSQMSLELNISTFVQRILSDR